MRQKTIMFLFFIWALASVVGLVLFFLDDEDCYIWSVENETCICKNDVQCLILEAGED